MCDGNRKIRFHYTYYLFRNLFLSINDSKSLQSDLFRFIIDFIGKNKVFYFAIVQICLSPKIIQIDLNK